MKLHSLSATVVMSLCISSCSEPPTASDANNEDASVTLFNGSDLNGGSTCNTDKNQ